MKVGILLTEGFLNSWVGGVRAISVMILSLQDMVILIMLNKGGNKIKKII